MQAAILPANKNISAVAFKSIKKVLEKIKQIKQNLSKTNIEYYQS